MKKVLILGHKGMLGNAVYRYLYSLHEYNIYTLNSRFGEDLFIKAIQEINPDFIVNCIGKIPQRVSDTQEYSKVNKDLPLFLDTLGVNIVHPTTDCEFSGDIVEGLMYGKQDIRDAVDEYGKSKADVSKFLEENSKNTKIIRTSIIGHEQNTHVSLLDWFLNQNTEVRGYENHMWNGVTTLEWAKFCEKIVGDWSIFPVLNQIGTSVGVSKYELLQVVKDVYKHNIEIKPFSTEISVNKCLKSDVDIKTIRDQLVELKEFYNK